MSAPNQESLFIDEFGPLALTRPTTTQDVGAIVDGARNERMAIYPVGGRTMLDYGLPPNRPGRALDLRNLNLIVDYPARDMTITVQAGITIAALQTELGSENQRLPVDVLEPDRATLGGAIATNASGSRRLGYGTLRDYVIGISVVNDEGKEIKAGGRVVKNVAGYDLCKLYVGSLGTLGVITQVTIKLRPMPEEQAIVIVPCESVEIEALLDLMHRSRTRPVCLDLLNAAWARYISRHSGIDFPEAPWLLVIGFEGNRSVVASQVQQIIPELGRDYAGGLEARIGAAAETVWQLLATQPPPKEAAFTLRANVLPSLTAQFCRDAAAMAENLAIQAHAGNGIIRGFAPASASLDDCRTILLKWQGWGRAARGNAVVTRCPATWKSMLPIWGSPRDDAWLMQLVKQKLDPRGVFNPGRFVGAI